MNYVASKVILAFLVGLLSCSARVGHSQAYRPPIEARVGDVATGTVVRQDTQTLILNTTPCNGDREKQIVIFHSPFETKPAEGISCPGGHTFQQITANQK
jgi:hypothetical protein